MTTPSGSEYSSSEHGDIDTTPVQDIISELDGSDAETMEEFYNDLDNIERLQNAQYQDSDGDGIPDAQDTQTTQYVTIVGEEVFVTDDTKDFVDHVNKTVANNVRSNSGFGGGYGASQPINRIFNIPGNVASFLGHAIPGTAHQNVLSGIASFSVPSKCDGT